jgi:hypothetical protein
MTDRLRRALVAREETFEKDGSEHGSSVQVRNSGVRARALPIVDDDEASEAPTLRPIRFVRSGSDELAPIHELLYRFDVGDHLGALAAAEALLDRSLVPLIVVPDELLGAMRVETSTALLLASIDGRSSLEVVLERCGLPFTDALRALCDLLDARYVALHPAAPLTA